MAPMITQCPYCSTAFAVNEAQLQAAAGNVRCGACLNVFLAEDNLLPVGTAAVNASDTSDTASFSATEPAWELLDEDQDESSGDEPDELTDEAIYGQSHAAGFDADAPAEADALDETDDESELFDDTDEADNEEPAQQSLLLDDAGRREPSLFALDDDLLEDEQQI